MADVELVIKMPEDVFKRTVFYREFRSIRDCIMTIKALEKAISLPKGHGRLIDADELELDTEWDFAENEFISVSQMQIDRADTIVPADTESEGKL